MTKPGKILEHALSRRACRAVENGHPWVFGESSKGQQVGHLVQLVDGRSRAIGWGLTDEGAISHRILGTGRAPKSGLKRVIENRLIAASLVRDQVFDDKTTAYRICNGAGDGLPGIVIDRYGSIAVLKLYSKAWLPHIESIVTSLQQLHWVESVYRKFGVARIDGRQGGVLLFGREIPDEIVVLEHGMKFLARIEAGQKTGLFLDQREHRGLVRGWAHSRTVTNLFAYNGGFSIAAALGGASRVITVDIAPNAIEDAKEIFRLNGIPTDRHGFDVADAFSWKPKDKQSFVIVDPPSLVRDKTQVETGLKAYRNLHRRVGAWVDRNGYLATASCTAWAKREQWMHAVAEGIGKSGVWSWHWTSTQPFDHPVSIHHPEAHYLKFALLRRR